jgi:hypothetical protein
MCAPRVTRHISIRYSSSCHTCVNMGASIFFTAAMIRAFTSARSRRRVLCLLCTKCTLHSNHRITRVVIFQHTKQLLPPVRPFSHYMHSHRLAAEMWTTMKNKLLGKQFLSFSFYLYRFRKYVSYGFPIINFCNPGVHYETPCIKVGLGVVFYFVIRILVPIFIAKLLRELLIT